MARKYHQFCIFILFTLLYKRLNGRMHSEAIHSAVVVSPVTAHGLTNCTYAYMKHVSGIYREWRWMMWDVEPDTIWQVNA